MITPVYEQNKKGRYVYLSEAMRLVRFRAYNDYDTEVLQKGDAMNCQHNSQIYKWKIGTLTTEETLILYGFLV